MPLDSTKHDHGIGSLYRDEHEPGADAKRVLLIGQDGSDYYVVNVDSAGAVATQGGGGGGGDGAILDGVTAATKATVKSYATDNPLCVRLTDSGGAYIATLPVSGTVTADAGTGLFTVDGTLGGIAGDVEVVQPTAADLNATVVQGTTPWITDATFGTIVTAYQYAEDVVHGNADIGAFMLAVSNSQGTTTFTNTDGAYSPIAVDSHGRVITGSERQHNTQTSANDMGTQVMGVRNDNADVTLSTANLNHSEWSVDSNGRTLISGTASMTPVVIEGDTTHGDTDGNRPVKIGAYATDYEPDSGAEEGPTAVDAGDRVNVSANLRGELITGVKSQYVYPTEIDITYGSDVTTTATSDAIECWQYRVAAFQTDFGVNSETGPTDIRIEILESGDGTTFADSGNGPLGSWLYDDATVFGMARGKRLTFPIAAHSIKIKVTTTGTGATDVFSMDNSILYMRT